MGLLTMNWWRSVLMRKVSLKHKCCVIFFAHTAYEVNLPETSITTSETGRGRRTNPSSHFSFFIAFNSTLNQLADDIVSGSSRPIVHSRPSRAWR